MAIDIEAPGADLAALVTALADLLIPAAFRATLAASLTTIASGTPTKIVYDVEGFDRGGHFAAGTWTPPAGLVHINAGVAISGTNLASADQQVKIYKNGSPVASSSFNGSANGGKPNVPLVDVADGNDTYEVYVVISTTSGQATVIATGASGVATYFQGICYGQ